MSDPLDRMAENARELGLDYGPAQRKDILTLAREAGFTQPEGETWYEAFPQGIEIFASLVRADEREACHALRQTLPNPYEHCQVSAHAYDMAIAAYGAAIRARENT